MDDIRFSYLAMPADRASWLDLARRCEDLGMRALLVPDHPGVGPSPFVALAAAASVTEDLRLGSYVVNAGVREAIHIAVDVATLDVVSGGRVDLGIGAGHTPAEWEAIGRRRPGPDARIDRLLALTIAIRRLLGGETVPAGDLDVLADVTLTAPRPVQNPVPILLGGSNSRMLAWAGAHADAVGLAGLGRTRPDGHMHDTRWTVAEVDRHVGLVRSGAESVGRPAPELEVLVQALVVTDDPEQALEPWVRDFGVNVEDGLSVPYLLIGTVDKIVAQIREAGRRWGIQRWVVRGDTLPAAETILAALRNASV